MKQAEMKQLLYLAVAFLIGYNLPTILNFIRGVDGMGSGDDGPYLSTGMVASGTLARAPEVEMVDIVAPDLVRAADVGNMYGGVANPDMRNVRQTVRIPSPESLGLSVRIPSPESLGL